MGREIKFRAWDIDRKLMFDVFGFDVNHIHGWLRTDEEKINCAIPPHRRDCELMQFTGLRDCKTGVFPEGQEIYEGDIVKVFIVGGPFGGVDGPNDTKSGHKVGVIQFADGCFEIKFSTTRDYLKCYVANNSVDVIGNIYENPELLVKYNA